jgi:hypothetical protein
MSIYAIAPMIKKLFEDVQIIVAAAYCFPILGADAVAPAETIVTPAPCENVT